MTGFFIYFNMKSLIESKIGHKVLALVLFGAISLFVYSQQQEPQINRHLDMSVFINQAGYHPNAAKYCVTIPGAVEFEVLNVETNNVVYKGKLEEGGKDFGDYLVGTFTPVETPGTYYIRSGKSRSFPFKISKYVYEEPMQLIVSYFSKQRCGNSTTGFLSPCHLEDGWRKENRNEHKDVSGGWHDASDLRKWVGATIYGMVGILRMSETLQPLWDNGQVQEELLWGNRYFLNMQEPEGYVMAHVGGDLFKHGDSNRWTDNIMFNDDDRGIETKPLDNGGQYTFVSVQAMMSRFMRSDPVYSSRCLAAAINCFNWLSENVKNYSTGVAGCALVAAIDLYKTTGESKYIDFAYRMADIIVGRQITTASGVPVSGFFRDNEQNDRFYSEISRADFVFTGLCQLVLTFPERQNAQYVDAIRRYCDNYLLVLSDKNAFNLMPYEIYAKEMATSRKLGGGYWYKYFMNPKNPERSDNWWVGINANITGKGIGLAMASRILKDPKLAAVAQRQLDWVLGANPFGTSTMRGVGYEHPKFPTAFGNSHYLPAAPLSGGGEFIPPTTHIPGAVLNGIGGDMNDMPDLRPGSYNTCEYWTPMIGLTMWLMAELTSMN